MNKTVKIASLVAAMLLLGAAFFAVSAAPSQPAGPSHNAPIKSLTKAGIAFEGLRANFLTTLTCPDGCAVSASTFTEEDAVNFQCGSTGATTCTLVVNQYTTSSGGGVSGSNRALCLLLDGAIVGACAYDGEDAADGSYSSINAIQTISGLAVGNHSTSSLIYSMDGTTVYTTSNVYSVFKP